MKDKTLSKNLSDIIKDNMEQIKSINNWDVKIGLIKETKDLIKEEKLKLSELKESMDKDLEDDNIDFGKMDLEKVISKIQKNSNLEKKVENINLLKLWLKQQKNKVCKI